MTKEGVIDQCSSHCPILRDACIRSACMMWRTYTTRAQAHEEMKDVLIDDGYEIDEQEGTEVYASKVHGYCGMAGKPRDAGS